MNSKSRILAIALTAACLLGAVPTAAFGGIGLTRQEALRDAETVVRGYFPKPWKQNERNLRCREHGEQISCPPLTFYKKISAEEIEILYSLVTSEHPYHEIWGNVFVHADPSSSTGFYFSANRCKGTSCYELGGA